MEQRMQHHKLVLPEHLNDHGTLYGGYLLQWVDEFSYVTASVMFPQSRFVTVALQNVEFHHRIECGQIIRFEIGLLRRGNTSLEFDVQAKQGRSSDGDAASLFATRITFVAVDENGRKTPVR